MTNNRLLLIAFLLLLWALVGNNPIAFAASILVAILFYFENKDALR